MAASATREATTEDNEQEKTIMSIHRIDTGVGELSLGDLEGIVGGHSHRPHCAAAHCGPSTLSDATLGHMLGVALTRPGTTGDDRLTASILGHVLGTTAKASG